MGDRLGIIAGSGEFPFLVATEAQKKGSDVVVAAISGETDPGLGEKVAIIEWFGMGEIAGVIDFFKSRRMSEVLIAGKFSPESVFRAKALGDSAARIVSQAGGKRPVPLIGALIAFLERQGIVVLDPSPLLKALFCLPGVLTATPPSSETVEDIEYGLAVAKTLADLDIGQTVIIKNKAVVAVEGIEGTDQAILRGGQLAGPGVGFKPGVIGRIGRRLADRGINIYSVITSQTCINLLVDKRDAALIQSASASFLWP